MMDVGNEFFFLPFIIRVQHFEISDTVGVGCASKSSKAQKAWLAK